MTDKGMPLKLFLVHNMAGRNEEDKMTLMYNKYPNGDDKIKWKSEHKALMYKFHKLKLKVEERMPIYSRVDDHKWFLTKDKYGFLYVILADTSRFEEEFIFSLRGKIVKIIHNDRYVFMEPSEQTMVSGYFWGLGRQIWRRGCVVIVDDEWLRVYK